MGSPEIKTTKGRVTSGVKLLNMDEGVKLVSVDKIREDAITEDDSAENAEEESNDIEQDTTSTDNE